MEARVASGPHTIAGMPTTVTGFLLFVAMLLPGFAYVTTLRRERPERRLSAFHETATVASVSVVFDVIAVGILIGFRAAFPGVSPDIGRLIQEPGRYVSDNYVAVFVWLVLVLLVVCGLASGVAWLVARRQPHESIVSSWWLMFETTRREMEREYDCELIVRVACYLDDGSVIEGTVSNFNQHADDIPDRDLVLVAPIERTRPDGEREIIRSHLACVSARDITTLLAYYRSPPESDAPDAPEAPVDEPVPPEGLEI